MVLDCNKNEAKLAKDQQDSLKDLSTLSKSAEPSQPEKAQDEHLVDRIEQVIGVTKLELKNVANQQAFVGRLESELAKVKETKDKYLRGETSEESASAPPQLPEHIEKLTREIKPVKVKDNKPRKKEDLLKEIESRDRLMGEISKVLDTTKTEIEKVQKQQKIIANLETELHKIKQAEIGEKLMELNLEEEEGAEDELMPLPKPPPKPSAASASLLDALMANVGKLKEAQALKQSKKEETSESKIVIDKQKSVEIPSAEVKAVDVEKVLESIQEAITKTTEKVKIDLKEKIVEIKADVEKPTVEEPTEIKAVEPIFAEPRAVEIKKEEAKKPEKSEKTPVQIVQENSVVPQAVKDEPQTSAKEPIVSEILKTVPEEARKASEESKASEKSVEGSKAFEKASEKEAESPKAPEKPDKKKNKNKPEASKGSPKAQPNKKAESPKLEAKQPEAAKPDVKPIVSTESVWQKPSMAEILRNAPDPIPEDVKPSVEKPVVVAVEKAPLASPEPILEEQKPVKEKLNEPAEKHKSIVAEAKATIQDVKTELPATQVEASTTSDSINIDENMVIVEKADVEAIQEEQNTNSKNVQGSGFASPAEQKDVKPLRKNEKPTPVKAKSPVKPAAQKPLPASKPAAAKAPVVPKTKPSPPRPAEVKRPVARPAPEKPAAASTDLPSPKPQSTITVDSPEKPVTPSVVPSVAPSSPDKPIVLKNGSKSTSSSPPRTPQKPGNTSANPSVPSKPKVPSPVSSPVTKPSPPQTNTAKPKPTATPTPKPANSTASKPNTTKSKPSVSKPVVDVKSV